MARALDALTTVHGKRQWRPINPRAGALTLYGYTQALQVVLPRPRKAVLNPLSATGGGAQVDGETGRHGAESDQVGEIGFIGLWWDERPAEGPAAGPEEAFESDPEALRRLRIQTPKAVMYHDVIQTMSTGRVNIFTQRPLLRHLKHLTLKYFEIFCADTIPLLMIDADHAEAVYGPAARALVLSASHRKAHALRPSQQ